MTEKKEIKQVNVEEQTKIEEQSIIAIANDLKNILQASKKQSVIDKTSLFLDKALQHCLKCGDTSLFKKVFFIKVDNSNLYNRLGLCKYFEEHDVCFMYNVKKDSLKIFGNWKDLSESFKDWKERIKNEQASIKASLSKEDSLKLKFENKVKTLKPEEITLFKLFLESYQNQENQTEQA